MSFIFKFCCVCEERNSSMVWLLLKYYHSLFKNFRGCHVTPDLILCVHATTFPYTYPYIQFNFYQRLKPTKDFNMKVLAFSCIMLLMLLLSSFIVLRKIYQQNNQTHLVSSKTRPIRLPRIIYHLLCMGYNRLTEPPSRNAQSGSQYC